MTGHRSLHQPMTPPNRPSAASRATALLNLMVGSWISQAISVAAKLGLADLLEDGPRSCAELAEATKTHPCALYRVMRALASVGIFAEDERGRFELTPLADNLRTNASTSLREYAIFLGEPWHWRAWGDLLHSVRTGESAFEHAFGVHLFDHFAQHPDAAQIFGAAMTSRSRLEDRAIAEAYDFPRDTTIVDVGAGRGSLIATIRQQTPGARGILFDLPHVMAGCAALLREARLANRCQFVAGDFFSEVPPGGDIYLMKKVIHDWGDERAGSILANCRAGMAANARLLPLEHVIRPGNAPAFAKLLDLQMLVQTPGGRERTEAEYSTLLATSGLQLARIIPTRCPLSIIEALPS